MQMDTNKAKIQAKTTACLKVSMEIGIGDNEVQSWNETLFC